MLSEILNYIQAQRVGVLAVEMLDGSPHAATVHFAHTDEPLTFFCMTLETYRKAESILTRKPIRASFVIGFDENNMKTFQADGTISIIETNEEKELFEKIYFGKFPEKIGKDYGAPEVLFSFTPTWWRFTDWTTREGKMILTSE